jgi:hypothetical protein
MKQLLGMLALLLLGSCDGYQSASINTDKQNDIVADATMPSGRILRAGVFSKVSGGNVIDRAETSTGKALSKLVMTFIREAERIPIKQDTMLGYQYRLSGLPDIHSIQLRRVLKHPAFTLPDGTVKTGSDYIINKRVERNEVFGYDVYALNEDYEMVEGEWVFQLWFDDKKLVEQTFTTYWPEKEAQ